MKRPRRFPRAALAVILTLGLGCGAMAAEPTVEDPFGTTPTGPPAPAAAAKPAEAKPAAEPVETDPIVLTVRSTNPTRPDQLIWAARTVLDIGRPDEAKKYLKQLLDRRPAPATLTALQQEFGAGLFVRLTGEDKLQPEGGQVATAVLDAARQAFRDPRRLDGLIGKLTDGDPDTRRMALTDLREAGDAAAVALIRVWSDPGRAAQRAAAVEAVAALGTVAEGPLLGAMGASDPEVRRQAITALGLMKSREAIAVLLRPLVDAAAPPEVRRATEAALLSTVGAVPTLNEAQRYLMREVNRELQGRTSGGDHLGPAAVWIWDDTQQTSVARSMSAPSASRWRAVRLAQDLGALSPGSAESRKLFLTALLEWAKADADLGASLMPGQPAVRSLVAAEGAAATEEALAYAMETNHVAAAIGALEVLGDLGDERLLAGGGGEPRTVTRALRHPDPRLRFAAAAAIMTWDPTSPYPGSSHLVEALAFFLKTAGTRRVLVGHPRADLAQNIAGMLTELGFEADTATTGDGVVKRAITNPDFEVILVSDAIDSPPVKEVVQQLRHDARTARLPIGILAREPNLAELERFAEKDSLTRVFPRAHDVTGVVLQVRRLLELQDSTAITPDQRLRWAEAALDYFAHVAADTGHYLFPEVFAQQEPLLQALFLPPLTGQAAHVLGTFGSPEAQRALASLASQNDRGLTQRRAAASAFALAVARRRGLLLSRGEILAQYDRYNRSATLDQDTQKVLGAVLDAIEAPSGAKQ